MRYQPGVATRALLQDAVGASAPHFTEERKNSPEKVESHLHNCFYDVAGSS